MSDVTQILNEIEQGDCSATEKLLPLVYDELRRMASQKMAVENPAHTLQATALVHEAYIRLVDAEQVPNWKSRGHFFSAAAEAMRRILVDHARRKASQKRGGGYERLHIDAIDEMTPASGDKLIALDEALRRLSEQDPSKAEVVKLRYFAGLSVAETASALGISTATANRYWAYCRAWLQAELASGDASAGG